MFHINYSCKQHPHLSQQLPSTAFLTIINHSTVSILGKQKITTFYGIHAAFIRGSEAVSQFLKSGSFAARYNYFRSVAAQQTERFAPQIFRITPQAILLPAFPDGCVLKSSGWLWITTVLPITSPIQNRSVATARNAFPPRESSGGRSPACRGWLRLCGS